MTASGIRVGTAAITTRGFNEDDCRQVVMWMDEVLSSPDDTNVQARIKSAVHGYMANFPLYEK
jgi:glycine hydroxymethyltransferase